MTATRGRLFRRFDREEIERDIGAELGFHLDLLTQEYLQQDMSPEEAKDAALKQFGNVEHIKDQCAEVSRRSHPFVLALKCLLSVMFLAGVLMRILAGDFHIKSCGDLISAVSILSWLMLYVRLHASQFRSQHEISSPLKLTDQTSFAVYDQSSRTPVERVISR
ncbi:MAG: permease prefix domain 1-containing protein [Acidobacteriota bacterium]|nr:permease prefix domain 1-containing protein [Acidobacteriota bacterium]